jgi:hypothetical protein
MDRSSRVSRGTPVRVAAALVAAGALSIGAAACGSGSNKSASVPKKQAGAQRGTRLAIFNELGSDKRWPAGPIRVTICAVNEGCDGRVIDPNQSTAVANSSESTPEDVNGTLTYPNGARVEFSAGNPNVGPPWIKVTNLPDGDNIRQSLVLPGECINGLGGAGCSANGGTLTQVNCGRSPTPQWCLRADDTSNYVRLALSVGGEDVDVEAVKADGR